MNKFKAYKETKIRTVAGLLRALQGVDPATELLGDLRLCFLPGDPDDVDPAGRRNVIDICEASDTATRG